MRVTPKRANAKADELSKLLSTRRSYTAAATHHPITT